MWGDVMPELQQPDILGSYLSNYRQAMQFNQAQQDRTRQMNREDLQDERSGKQFDLNMQLNQLALEKLKHTNLIDILANSPDEVSFQRNLQRAVLPIEQGGLGARPEAVQWKFTDLPKLQEEAGVVGRNLDLQLKRAQIASTQAQVMAARALATKRSSPGGAGGEFDNTTFDNISNLRKEYQGATKDFGTVRDAYGRIKATSGSASPAGDIAMIYAFMKMLDPGSVVRETEFAVAQNAKPLLDRLGISWDSVKSAWQGNRLQPQVRQDFLNQANSLYSQQLGQYNNVRSTYGTLAQRFNFDPSLVLTDQTGGIQPEAPPQPQSFTAGGRSGLADRDWISEADRIIGR